jgi:hypothetical protein
MPQFGFYMAGAGVAALGRAGLLLAWDPHDRGPSAADDIDLGDIGLYSLVSTLPSVGPALFKMRTRSPVAIPAEGCPDALDGGPGGDFVVHFGVKAGASIGTSFADGLLEVFDGAARVYGISPPMATVRIELARGSVAVGLTEYSMQDRMVLAALEDPLEDWAALLGRDIPAIDLWRDLMTSNQELNWSPI